MKIIPLSDEAIIGLIWEFGNGAVCENGEVPEKIEYYKVIAQEAQRDTLRQLEPYMQNMGSENKPSMWIMISERDWQEIRKQAGMQQ